MRANVDLLAPVPAVRHVLRDPMKRFRLDLRKSPAHGPAFRMGTLLNDVTSAGAPDLLREEVRGRVVPQDAPRIETGIEDAQRGAVPVARPWQLLDAGLALAKTR